MGRIGLVVVLAISLFLAPLGAAADAQEHKAGKVWRIGTLDYGSEVARAHLWDAFRQGLRDLGYVEGQNIVLESRWANGRAGELPRLAEEFVRLRVDLLAIASTPAALAMKHATTTIPVVFMSVGESGPTPSRVAKVTEVGQGGHFLFCVESDLIVCRRVVPNRVTSPTFSTPSARSS